MPETDGAALEQLSWEGSPNTVHYLSMMYGIKRYQGESVVDAFTWTLKQHVDSLLNVVEAGGLRDGQQPTAFDVPSKLDAPAKADGAPTTDEEVLRIFRDNYSDQVLRGRQGQ